MKIAALAKTGGCEKTDLSCGGESPSAAYMFNDDQNE